MAEPTGEENKAGTGGTGWADADVTGQAVSGASAGDELRRLVEQATERGAPMVSSQAMQAGLFRVYDRASVDADALALVQRHLGLTLDRTWYSAEEVEALAGELDGLLGDAADISADIADALEGAGDALEGAGAVAGGAPAGPDPTPA